MPLLRLAARHGRLCLILGLLAGLGLPGVAQMLRPWLGELVALLLAITAFRVGPRAALGGLDDLRRSLVLVLGLQLALPLLALAAFTTVGWLAAPFAMAVVLMLAAPSVSGAPNFAIMTGQDPAPAMRLLVLGTALFPVTALPVLWVMPMLGGADAIGTALRLVFVVLVSVGLGFLIRLMFPAELNPQTRTATDGLAAVMLAVVVVGLMSAIGPLLQSDPVRLMLWLSGVMAVNFGLQIAIFFALRPLRLAETVAMSIIAGNRNIALFLIVLPEQITDPLLIYIGCYQIPMYLTPIVMARMHRRAPA